MIQSVDTALTGSVTGQTQCPNCGHKGVSGEGICTQCGQSMYSRTQGISDDIAAETDLRNLEAAYEATPADREDGSNRSGLQAVAIEAALSSNEQNALDTSAEEEAGVSDPTDTKLSKAEQDDVRELQDRDQEVRTHEQAHIAAGGGVVQGSATYTYETGPDGKQYAIGGEVAVDVSSVPGDPDATQDKAQTIRRSALAPASPSAQDQNVAAKAARMEAEARTEQQENELEEQEESDAAIPPALSEPSADAAVASTALDSAMEKIEQTAPLRTGQELHQNPYQQYALSEDDGSMNSAGKKARFISDYV